VRNYFLREENYSDIKRAPGDQMFILVQRFGELLRKLWNPRNFKAHVSPHEMLQAVVRCSKKKFQITEQGPFACLSLGELNCKFLWCRKLSMIQIVGLCEGQTCKFLWCRKLSRIPVQIVGPCEGQTCKFLWCRKLSRIQIVGLRFKHASFYDVGNSVGYRLWDWGSNLQVSVM